MTKKEQRTFTQEFKQQMVQLYMNGKPRKNLIQEYSLTPSSLDKWIFQYKASGSFKASCANTRTKVNVIKNNQHKYSISAMCIVLQLQRSTYYYEAKERGSEYNGPKKLEMRRC